MAANFFVKADESFTIVIPFDISELDAPSMVWAESLQEFPIALQEIDEEDTSYETMTFRKPSWGLDCFLRELAYEGGNLKDRVFSAEKFDEVRLKYLLLNSSFFNDDNKATFTKEGNYEVLSPVSTSYIRNLEPFVLKMFLAMASSVWDLGTTSKNLMTKDDYLLLRNDKEGFKKLTEKRGLAKPAKKKQVAKTTPAAMIPTTESSSTPTSTQG